ncbi:MAG TPA: peptidylprolyl isomerase [Bryobacteraceae bacterium]|jgi:peptidyl-prolyl cis-trans isomerase A (cyclophilin A)|nr:peptidylprolyl isomerase [Bryobacteraceae bacterium]
MRSLLGVAAVFLSFMAPRLQALGAAQTSTAPVQKGASAAQKGSSGTAKKAATPALPPVPLPSDPGLYAIIYTTEGNIVCRLFEKEAPKAVANFTGLATGTRAWTDPATGKLVHRPLYSGTIFHRVIPDFMIQGGDPLADGTGSPGYTFQDEFAGDHQFDRPGILAMANSGPNTNGSQFFITVAPTPWLNHKHTIFGEVVSGQDVADAISKVPRNEENDKPNTPVRIVRILIRRVPAAAAKPAATPAPAEH